MTVDVFDNADGTLTISGATVTDNGDGTLTIADPFVVVIDNGDGTLTIAGDPPPGAGLTATPQPAASPPSVRLDITGVPAATVTVYRVDALGNRTPVRSADPATLTGGAWVGFDYEAPFGALVSYVADDGAGNLYTAGPVELDVQTPWLIHPGIASLSMSITVAKVGDRTRTVNRGVHQPLGRATPIPITDGVRHAPTFDLTVRTTGVTEEDALLNLLADAETLLLQINYSGVDRVIYDWVSIGDVGDSYLVDWLGSQWDVWTLPCTVTDAPAGELQTQRTWAQLVAEFDTWADVVAAYASWRDVVTDTRIGS